MISFTKYQGTGNDFIIIDAFTKKDVLFDNRDLVSHLCDRKFGVGADGLIFLCPSENADFKMVYYNADGAESSMCGNGGRCIVDFAYRLGVIGKETKFEAIDGLHRALWEEDMISLEMSTVDQVRQNEQDYILNTGSPHYVSFVDAVREMNVFESGSKIRNSIPFKEEGINVNFVSVDGPILFVRTFERGVEDETLSCGTGVTAAAIAMACKSDLKDKQELAIHTLGGSLKVKLERKSEQLFDNIWLCGPATKVFDGTIVV